MYKLCISIHSGFQWYNTPELYVHKLEKQDLMHVAQQDIEEKQQQECTRSPAKLKQSNVAATSLAMRFAFADTAIWW